VCWGCFGIWVLVWWLAAFCVVFVRVWVGIRGWPAFEMVLLDFGVWVGFGGWHAFCVFFFGFGFVVWGLGWEAGRHFMWFLLRFGIGVCLLAGHFFFGFVGIWVLAGPPFTFVCWSWFGIWVLV